MNRTASEGSLSSSSSRLSVPLFLEYLRVSGWRVFIKI